jgi:hypothetical protein
VAECDVCGAEMRTARSCALSELVVADRRRPRLPYGAETGGRSGRDRCRDCGVSTGGVHHPGCCVEECPVCGQQLFCCDCEKEEPRPLASS